MLLPDQSHRQNEPVPVCLLFPALPGQHLPCLLLTLVTMDPLGANTVKRVGRGDRFVQIRLPLTIGEILAKSLGASISPSVKWGDNGKPAGLTEVW